MVDNIHSAPEAKTRMPLSRY